MNAITKKQAQKLYDDGQYVYFIPSKLPPYVIFAPVCINKRSVNNFLEYIDWYEKKYCKKSIGKKVKFYSY